MKKLKLLVASLIILSISNFVNAQEKYAVLITGDYAAKGIPVEDQWNRGQGKSDNGFDEFWNDTYLMWKMLQEKGYSRENIIVLFADGQDYSAVNQNIADEYKPEDPTVTVTDYSASIANVNLVFNGLAYGTGGFPKVTEDDFLFVWTFDHGGPRPNEADPAYICLIDGIMYDYEFAALTNQIQAHKKVFWMQQCRAGGFYDDLAAPNTVFHSAGQPLEYAFRADDVPVKENEVINNIDYHHGEFNFHVYSATVGKSPTGATHYNGQAYTEADENNDNCISVLESYNWEDAHETIDKNGYYHGEDPLLSDLGNIAAFTSLKYPSLLHLDITNNQSHRGLIGISKEVTVKSGATLTIENNSKVEFTENGKLIIENGASLIIKNGVVINGMSENNSIDIYGNLNIAGTSAAIEPKINLYSTNELADVNLSLENGIIVHLGAELIINGSTLIIKDGAKLIIKPGQNLKIDACAELIIEGNGKLITQDGVKLEIEDGAILAFENGLANTQINASVNIPPGYIDPRQILPPSCIIASNEQWTNKNYKIFSDIVINNGGTLNISETSLLIRDTESIIVNPGGKLIVDNTTTDILETCNSDALWKGIIVLGNPNQSQYEHLQGVVKIRNGSRIENAEVGVYVGNPEVPGTAGGGIVYASNSEFINCPYGIYFDAYPLNNVSGIIQNRFETTDFLAGIGMSPRTGIRLNDTYALNITGNEFINTAPHVYSKKELGKGIFSINSGIRVKPSCSDSSGGYPCPEESLIPNKFENLYKGIDASFSENQLVLDIKKNEFINCLYGMYITGASDFKILSNKIDINTFKNSIGIYLAECSNFKVEGNKLTGKKETGYGMYLHHCLYGNEIYRNEFKNNNFGIIAEGNNERTQISCNTFNNNRQHIYIKRFSSIAVWQGSSTLPSGNKFFPNCVGTTTDIDNKGYTFKYFAENAPEYIPFCSSNVFTFIVNNHNECLPKYTGNTNSGTSYSSNPDDETESTETALAALVDGGNTEELAAAIDESTPEEALNLRNTLITTSPGLSDTVMIITSEKEEVLPPIMLKQVLCANPSAAKSPEVQTALDNREHPLPLYMREEINVSANILSEKDSLENQLYNIKSRRLNAVNAKITELCENADSLGTDSLEIILSQEQGLDFRYRLAEFYITEKRMTEAETILNAIPNEFSLSEQEQQMFNAYMQFFDIQKAILANGLTWFDISAEQKQAISAIANDTTSFVMHKGRAVLSMIDNMDYGYPLPDFEIPNNRGAHAAQGTTYPESFSVFPNPAKDYFILEYALSEKESPKEVFIAIFNDAGAEVKRFTLHKPANRFLIECENWEPGTYRCRKFVKGKIATEEKVVVGNDIAIIGNEEKNNRNILGLNAIESEKYFDIYPNPAKDYFFIKIHAKSIPDNAFIGISDAKATVVKKIALSNTKELIKISSSAWEKGVYTVSIIKNNKILETHKIVIE